MTASTKDQRCEALFKELPAKLREALAADNILDIYDLEEASHDDAISKLPGIGRAYMKKIKLALSYAEQIRAEPEPEPESVPVPTTPVGITVEKLLSAMAKADVLFAAIAPVSVPSTDSEGHLAYRLDRQALHEGLIGMPPSALLHMRLLWKRENGVQLMMVPIPKVQS